MSYARFVFMNRLAFCVSTIGAYVLAIAPGDPAVFSYDKANHMLAFVVLAILARLGWERTQVWIVAAGLIAFGGFIELSQALPIIHRDASWGDLAADAIATIVGLAVAIAGQRLAQLALRPR
jgi:hypothetical protein